MPSRNFRRRLSSTHFSEAYNNLGVALADLGRLEEAGAAFARASQLKPDYADPHYNLGILNLAQSRPNAAIAELQRAVVLGPGNTDYHYRLGLALSQLGDVRERSRRCKTLYTSIPIIPTRTTRWRDCWRVREIRRLPPVSSRSWRRSSSPFENTRRPRHRGRAVH